MNGTTAVGSPRSAVTPTPRPRPEVLVSIHDVMPETLTAVSDLLADLVERGWEGIRLLVVPGKRWRDSDIDALHRWQGDNHLLAGHGWRHRVDTSKLSGPVERLHSLLVSRDVAEHLVLDADGILELLARCHRWFEDQALAPPDYYVPPAWAMGSIAPAQLRGNPFRHIEYFSGVYDAEDGSFLRLPLVGFEADTGLRAVSLRLWNAINRRLTSPRHPLRIAIHPRDMELRLARDLAACLERFSPRDGPEGSGV